MVEKDSVLCNTELNPIISTVVLQITEIKKSELLAKFCSLKENRV